MKKKEYQTPSIVTHQLFPKLRVLEDFSAGIVLDELEDGGEF